MFAGNAVLARAPLSGSSRADGPAPAKEAFVGAPSIESDPPNLSAGLLFLGSAIRVSIAGAAHPVFVGLQPPPPIRPNVQVQVVSAGPARNYPDSLYSCAEVVLYFG